MKEFLQNLFDSGNERLKNPFIGAYITSFLLINWRPICILFFSDWKMECKILHINENYCKPEAVMYPLFFALFYVLAMPFVQLVFDAILSVPNRIKFYRKGQVALEILKQKKEEAKLEREIADEKAGTSEVLNLQKQIDNHENERNRLLEQINSNMDQHTKELSRAKSREEALQEQLADEIARRRNSVEQIVQDLSFDDSTIFISLAEQFLKREVNPKAPITYKVADKNKFVKLGLLSETDKNVAITDLGRKVFTHLTTIN